jgi:hypothetical protein
VSPAAKSYPCPCCGYMTQAEPPGSYEICPLCFWEDDALQLEFATTLDGGANHLTLVDAQRNFAALGACEESAMVHVRAPVGADRRDPSWRPVDLSRDVFESWSDPEHRRAPDDDECLYYWRPTFWRLSAGG